MSVVSTRINDQIERELDQFIEEEKIERSGAVRKLLLTGLEEWKKKRALQLLSEGKITFNKAAEYAGMDVWDFNELVRRTRTIWVSDEWVEEDLDQ
jgi:predicted HTH domain antitoxin